MIVCCSMEIFKKLHFSTFNSVANVCVRFNRIAKEAFRSKYQSKQINLLELELNRQPTISTIEEFLSNFGTTISSLSTIKIGPCHSIYFPFFIQKDDCCAIVRYSPYSYKILIRRSHDSEPKCHNLQLYIENTRQKVTYETNQLVLSPNF